MMVMYGVLVTEAKIVTTIIWLHNYENDMAKALPIINLSKNIFIYHGIHFGWWRNKNIAYF